VGLAISEEDDESNLEVIVDSPVEADIDDWSGNTISVTFYADASTPAGAYGVYVSLCGGYWDPGDDINSEACIAGPAFLNVIAAPAPTVSIQVPTDFVSSMGNGLVLLGGPGGLTTTAITANGSPAGGTVTWTAGPHLQINGVNSVNASVTGTGASVSGGDTWVSVQYTVNGQPASASVRFTVLNPTTFRTSFSGEPGNTTVQYTADGLRIRAYSTRVTYFAYDQMNPPNPIALPGIPWTESLATLSVTAPPNTIFTFVPPDNQPLTAYSFSDGSMLDSLYIQVPDGIPSGFAASRSQSLTVNGFAFTPAQLQAYGPASATIQSQSLHR
jgi:hypothetical protein